MRSPGPRGSAKTAGHGAALSKTAKLSPGRLIALRVLIDARETGRYAREVAADACSSASLDTRDAAFARRLALGVTGCSGCLDDALNRVLDDPSSVSPDVRDALRLGAYEMLYLGTAPQVAVSQGVELARICAHGATGLANAVLRRVAEQAGEFLAAAEVPERHRAMVSRARRAGLPTWLVRRIVDSLGELRAEAMLAAQLEPAPLAVQVNPLRLRSASCSFGVECVEGVGEARAAGNSKGTRGAGGADADEPLELPDAAALEMALQGDGARMLSLPGAYTVDRVGELARTGAFARADVVASDYHAQLIAAAATREGSCLEIGAGRGTKTFMMLAHAERRSLDHEHVALDLYEGKCRANAERIECSGLGEILTAAGDATDLDTCLAEYDEQLGRTALFDTVFVDAPCSGTGTMRRHGEIPWRLTPLECDRDLPELQLALLRAAARRVAPGGQLIYATCSVLRAENGDVVTKFLGSPEGEGFAPVPLSDALAAAGPAYSGAVEDIAAREVPIGTFQSYPYQGGFDGHFCARFVRL